jgi:hypothetical protein
MKIKIIIFLCITQAVACFAESDNEYKNKFQINHYQSCYGEMTTGSDKVESKLAMKICSCLSDKTVATLSVPELKKYDKNPMAYKDLIAKFVSQCLI